MDAPPPLEREALSKFISSLSTYSPAIPDALVQHHLHRAGFHTDDVTVRRLIALATQKFLADIANDAINNSRIRHTNVPAPKKPNPAREHLTLTVDDLHGALREYGLTLASPQYLVDDPREPVPEPPSTVGGSKK